MFKPIISRVMEVYRPGAIVLQCGADSLTGDRLGCFNLTVRGHGEAVRFVKSFNVPTLVLGGGGYNIRNVSRCWAYETSVLLDTEISNSIPYNDFFHYYSPDFQLHVQPSSATNQNSCKYLEDIKNKILQNLASIEHAPSVQMQQVPNDFFTTDMINGDAESDLEIDGSGRSRRKRQHSSEFYDDADPARHQTE